MKRFILPACLLTAVVALTAGCGGKEDINKNLKPIDPNAPRPVGAGAEPGKGAKAAPNPGMEPGPKAQAPSAPP